MSCEISRLSSGLSPLVDDGTCFGIAGTVEAPIVVFLIIPEVLILVTAHDVKVILGSIIEVMVILCVGTQ